MSLSATGAPPAGFVVDTIGGNFECVVGAHALSDGRVLAWERSGKLWMIDRSGQRISTAVLDISDEVQGGGDSGLLGLAVHPNFPAVSDVYLLYVVDRHHLLYAGTPSYSATSNLYYKATIGRLTRYTLDPKTNFTSTVTGSRKVLIGATASTGIPVLYSSHTVGSVVFGTDGSLLISTGDNASYSVVDIGGAALNANVTDALRDGIIRPDEDVGAFRSQMIDSMCGKVLRLDPQTGNGLSGNPWFEPSNPNSIGSRVWSIGLRNPFRMTLVPNTGSHDPLDADPGTLLVGDVGWGKPGSERIVMIKRGGLNLGWPLFEGLDYVPEFWGAMVLDRSLPMPDGSFIPFADRIQPESPSAEPFILSSRVVQAESSLASTDGGAQVGDYRTGFTGTGFRSLWNGRYVQFALAQGETESVTAAIRFSQSGDTPTPIAITLDGVNLEGSWTANPTGSPTTWRVLRVPLGLLAAGEHSLRVTKISGASSLLLDGAWLEGESSDSRNVVPTSLPTFVHHTPIVCWRQEARTPGFNAFGAPTGFLVGSPSGAIGDNFSGTCAVGGPWINFSSWPLEYHGAYFGDYTSGWIRVLDATLSGQCGSKSAACKCAGVVHQVRRFDEGVQGLVGLYADPYSESLLSAQWVQLKRYRWLPNGSLAPAASVAVSTHYGASPLSIQFDASGSKDPEGQPVSFEWDFGDGSPKSTEPSPRHIFEAPNSMPTRFDVTLRICDPGGAESTWTTVIGVNNTPPSVDILAPMPGQRFSTRRAITTPLIASAEDLEHDSTELSFQWAVVLHHNTHAHPEPPMQGAVAETILQALQCGDSDTYWYEVTLVVRDAHGLSTSKSVRIDPDCAGRVGCAGDLDANGLVDIGDFQLVLLCFGTTDAAADLDANGDVNTADMAFLLLLMGECEPL